MITVDLTTEEWQVLWAMCMAEMEEDIRLQSVAKKLTYAVKEQKNG